MADYCFIHERHTFECHIRSPVAAAWRRGSFAPCRELAAQWTPRTLEYASRYHLPPEELLIPQVARGCPFDRALWRLFVGELLAVAAVAMPELPTHLESLAHLLASEHPHPDLSDRPALPAVYQALLGSRDLTFGLATYRPGHAGYNNSEDVARIAAYLHATDPTVWSAEQFHGFAGTDTEDDRAEELAFAREWLGVLTDLYVAAAGADHVVILERIF
ncbi:MAG: hypothetical protein U0736_17380 [Gemmataceae bacterium]